MLAMKLHKTVRELLATTDAQELAEWKIINRYHPIDDGREDARFALVCSTLANCHRGKGQQAFTVKDFMPDYSGKKQKLSNFQKFLLIPGLKVVRKKAK